MNGGENPTSRRQRIDEAIAWRRVGESDRAREQLLALGEEFPDDAEIAYQTACTHDALGLEAEALPFYHRAIDAGEALDPADRQGAFLGLGSSYRALGRYAEAVTTLRRGVEEFPENGGLRTFLAMALHNTGEHGEAVRLLLHLLAATSKDPEIADYRKAIEYYADRLDETWPA